MEDEELLAVSKTTTVVDRFQAGVADPKRFRGYSPKPFYARIARKWGMLNLMSKVMFGISALLLGVGGGALAGHPSLAPYLVIGSATLTVGFASLTAVTMTRPLMKLEATAVQKMLNHYATPEQLIFLAFGQNRKIYIPEGTYATSYNPISHTYDISFLSNRGELKLSESTPEVAASGSVDGLHQAFEALAADEGLTPSNRTLVTETIIPEVSKLGVSERKLTTEQQHVVERMRGDVTELNHLFAGYAHFDAEASNAALSAGLTNLASEVQALVSEVASSYENEFGKVNAYLASNHPVSGTGSTAE